MTLTVLTFMAVLGVAAVFVALVLLVRLCKGGEDVGLPRLGLDVHGRKGIILSIVSVFLGGVSLLYSAYAMAEQDKANKQLRSTLAKALELLKWSEENSKSFSMKHEQIIGTLDSIGEALNALQDKLIKDTAKPVPQTPRPMKHFPIRRLADAFDASDLEVIRKLDPSLGEQLRKEMGPLHPR